MARRKKGENINGWLIIDKPAGMGSTDVVNITRRMFNANKNGHTGTLDPFATGVLPIAFGEATKLIPQVTEGIKEYEFVLCFGAETASGDTESAIVKTCDNIPSEVEIQNILSSFIGEIKQVPPAYSAIKINGQRAYDLVRKGKNVDMPERIVSIYDLKLLEMMSDNKAKFKVQCSKGTYIRTLGMDLAKKLGSLGYLQELRRTKCGVFSIDDTILLENLKKIVHSDDLKVFLRPLLTSLRDIAVIAVSDVEAEKLRHGQAISPKNFEIAHLLGAEVAAVCGDCLTAIVRVEEQRISPIRVFNY